MITVKLTISELTMLQNCIETRKEKVKIFFTKYPNDKIGEMYLEEFEQLQSLLTKLNLKFEECYGIKG